MSYLLCFMVEALKPASQRKKITPNNGVPSYFWYLLKSCGFIQNRHIIIESEAATNVQYSPSLRNNQFFLSCCVYFSSKIKRLKKVRKIRFFKISIFQKFVYFKKKRQINAKPIWEAFKPPQKVSKTADFSLKPAVFMELVT